MAWLADVQVCVTCYEAHHNLRDSEYSPDYDPDKYTAALSLLKGQRIADKVCIDHTWDDDAVCPHCGADDPDNGHTTFSKAKCEGCGSSDAGERYRLAVWS